MKRNHCHSEVSSLPHSLSCSLSSQLFSSSVGQTEDDDGIGRQQVRRGIEAREGGRQRCAQEMGRGRSWLRTEEEGGNSAIRQLCELLPADILPERRVNEHDLTSEAYQAYHTISKDVTSTRLLDLEAGHDSIQGRCTSSFRGPSQRTCQITYNPASLE